MLDTEIQSAPGNQHEGCVNDVNPSLAKMLPIQREVMRPQLHSLGDRCTGYGKRDREYAGGNHHHWPGKRPPPKRTKKSMQGQAGDKFTQDESAFYSVELSMWPCGIDAEGYSETHDQRVASPTCDLQFPECSQSIHPAMQY